MGMERDLHDLHLLLDSVVGEPPRRVTAAAVRRRVVRRRTARALSAGLAAVLACGLGVAVSSGAARPGPGPAGGAREPAGPPRYYVASDSGGGVIRDTATGRVTATIRAPLPGAYCGQSFAAAAYEAFFMPCAVQQTASRPYESVIYRFRVTRSGQAAGLAPVRGGVLKGMLIGTNIAASPDGSEVAAQVFQAKSGTLSTAAVPAGILVIDTRTGRRALWHTGPYKPGTVQFAGGTDLSFTRDGSELVVLESRCPRDRDLTHCGAAPDNQVRAYSPAGRGGSLEAGRVLLRASALGPRGTNLFDAFVTPGGSALTALLSTCPRHGLCTQSVARIPVTGRGSLRVLYRVRAGTAFKGVLGRFFSTDPTGRYLILDSQVGNGRVNGWISHGRLHLLTPSNGSDVGYETW